jgi:transposase-like protein
LTKGEPPRTVWDCLTVPDLGRALGVPWHAAPQPLRQDSDRPQGLEEGWAPAAAAESMGILRATAYKWLRRFRDERLAGLADRSSRPHRSPRRLSSAAELEILELRREGKLGPHRLAGITGRPRSTCYAIRGRHRVHRLPWMDRPTGRVIRRYEREAPGELIHVDVKKLGRIPPGGGHRVRGRSSETPRLQARATGSYDFVHAAVDDHSRLAYVGVHADERGTTCTAFLRRARAFCQAHGIRVRRLMTDNAKNYVLSQAFQEALVEMGARHVRIAPCRSQANGKVCASTGSSSRTGPTAAPTQTTGRGWTCSRGGSTCTTAIGLTPPWAASHPSLASTTSRGTTASVLYRRFLGKRVQCWPGSHRRSRLR